MRGIVLGVVVSLLLCACSDGGEPARPAAPDAAASPAPETVSAALLAGITSAERSLVYSGYKTASHGEDGGGRRTRMRVTRLADGRMVMEWQRDGRTARRWVVRHRHRWIDDPSLLLANYDVVLAEEPANDVAWRPVRRIEIRSRRPGRPALTLYVDAETHLVLAERLRDHDGVQRFAWQFDTLDYEPDPLAVDEAEIVAAPTQIEADPADCGWSTLTLSATPEGFRRVACRRAADGSLVEYWSDGLAAFEFRQRAATDLAGTRDGELERRECSGRAAVTGLVAGVEVTLQGNLPVDELEAVAAGLRVRP